MSYGVYLEIPKCDHCARGPTTVYDSNMTSNVSGIWYRALMAALGKTVPADWGTFGGAPHPLAATFGGDQWDDKLGAFGPLAGMTGGDAIPVLERAAEHIEANPDIYEPFEPENGWGNAAHAAEFLRSLRAAWIQTPSAILSVSR